MDLRPPDAVHAGDEVTLHIHLHNASGAARYGIGFQADGNAAPTLGQCARRACRADATAAHANAACRAAAPVITTRFPPRRLPRLELLAACRQRSGSIRRQKRPRRPSHLSPRPARARPRRAARAAGARTLPARSYCVGDSPRHVLWRKSVALMDQGQAPWVRDRSRWRRSCGSTSQTAGGDLEASLRLTAGCWWRSGTVPYRGIT